MVNLKKYIKFRLINPFKVPRVKEIIRLAFPVMIGYSAISMNHLVGRSIASSLGVGSVSALYYSQVLEQFATSIIIVNVGNVMFSYFSTYNATNQIKKIGSKLNNILSILTIILIPISFIAIKFSTELVKIVYFRGGFTIDAVELSALALKGYALAFPLVAVRDILTKSMYAFQDTASPMRNVTISLLLGLVFSIILSRWLGVFGITLGTGLSVFVGAVLNLCSIYKHIPQFKLKKLLITGVKGLVAIGGVGFVIQLIFIATQIGEIHLLGLTGLTIVIFIVYFLFLILLQEENTLQLFAKINKS